MAIAGYLQDAKNQQKKLAENLTAKGVTALATEKYDSLVSKVAQIEELRGEERVLDNITQYNDTPQSIVQIEYPEEMNLISYPYTQTTRTENGVTFTDNGDGSITVNGTATANASFIFTQSLNLLKDTTYAWNLDLIEGTSYSTSITQEDLPAVGTYTPSVDIEDATFLLSVISGTTLNNVTIRQPILYEVKKNIDLQLSSKNLIPYPYTQTTRTENGVTFTDNGDGSITANGTATATTEYVLYQGNIFPISNTVYTISGCPSGGSMSTYYIMTRNGFSDTGTGLHIVNNRNDLSRIVIRISKGVTVENIVFKPQLELGSTATLYTKYISDFSNTKITVCGKNLWFGASREKLPAQSNNYYANQGFGSKPYLDLIHALDGETAAVNYDIDLEVYTYPPEATIWYTNGVTNGLSPAAKIHSDGETAISIELRARSNSSATLGLTPTLSNIQLELGSTVTSYEPYQGQTYTATSDGKVTGISSIYPITNIYTDTAGALITAYRRTPGNSFMEILPSEGKNGITKVQQPTVDSSVDYNIKPENIKKDVSILGTIGTLEPTQTTTIVEPDYTYDSTTKTIYIVMK